MNRRQVFTTAAGLLVAAGAALLAQTAGYTWDDAMRTLDLTNDTIYVTLRTTG